MDFTLSDEQKMLVDNVESFVKKDSPLARFRAMRDTDLGYSDDVWKHMAELGWLALLAPEAVGGLGMPFVDTALVLEQLGKTLVPEPYLSSVILGGTAVAKIATADQQASLLTPMVEGTSKLALAYAEANSRYDLSWVETRASGDKLSGTKVWVLNGDSADTLLVSARTAGEAGDRDGISLFAVDPKGSGVTLTGLRTIDGRKAAQVVLDGAPGELLGTAGQAIEGLEATIDMAAAAACAEGAGLMQAAFDMTHEYLGERKQFGQHIGSFQALQHRLVDMFVELQLCKNTMLLAALRAEDAPSERKRAVAIAKSQLAMGGHFLTREAIQLHGGIGVTDEHDIGLYFKRLNALAGLFGDEHHHLGNLSSAYLS